MQPNEPSQNQPQNQYQPATNVPDYLQLSSTSPTQKSKKPLIIGALLLVAGIFSAANIVPLMLRQSSPNEKFYNAVDAMLQTRYADRTYTVTRGSSQEFKATISTDFSDSARPKSTIDYTLFATGEITGDKNLNQGSIVVTNPTDFSARLSRSQNTLPKGASLNKWYKISNPTISTTTTTAAVFDYLKLRNVFNVVYAPVPIGNLSVNRRQQVIDAIRSKQVYKVKSVVAETLNGAKVTKYNVTINSSMLDTVFGIIAKDLNIDGSKFMFVNISPDVVFWVDDSNSRIIKSLQKTKLDSPQEIETRYDYPSSLDIRDPSPVTTLL